MRAAVESGCTLWNGGEFYGLPMANSLTLLQEYFENFPEDADKVVLNIKGAVEKDLSPNGSAEHVRKSVENCLSMLGPRGSIKMFECARRDPGTPLKETLSELAKLVEEGKIGGVALSEVSAATIREAAAITKITAVEVELSLWTTDPLRNGIASACAELKIPIIAYSPLGRGMLTGQLKSWDDIPEKDIRHILPRFEPKNFDANLKLVKELEKFAGRKGCTCAQLALSWLVCLGQQEGMPEIFPIPGATTVERVKENASVVELTGADMREIEGTLSRFEVAGDRYSASGMKLANG
jgi:pyridoxine 4-dehydrogenase